MGCAAYRCEHHRRQRRQEGQSPPGQHYEPGVRQGHAGAPGQVLEVGPHQGGLPERRGDCHDDDEGAPRALPVRGEAVGGLRGSRPCRERQGEGPAAAGHLPLQRGGYAGARGCEADERVVRDERHRDEVPAPDAGLARIRAYPGLRPDGPGAEVRRHCGRDAAEPRARRLRIDHHADGVERVQGHQDVPQVAVDELLSVPVSAGEPPEGSRRRSPVAHAAVLAAELRSGGVEDGDSPGQGRCHEAGLLRTIDHARRPRGGDGQRACRLAADGDDGGSGLQPGHQRVPQAAHCLREATAQLVGWLGAAQVRGSGDRRAEGEVGHPGEGDTG